MATPTFRQDRDGWQKFCTARPEYLIALAETVEKAFLRRDTTHPVFGGCIDWHSSVHGAFALLTAARLTGQGRWVEVVDSVLKPDCLEAEGQALKQGAVDHELPYGFAWFLRLAREREEGWGKKDLRPLAAEIAKQLEQWLISLTDEAVRHHAQRSEYGNLSWPLLNLWEWANWNGSGELVEKLVAWTRSRLLGLDLECPSTMDHPCDEFFAPALQRCRALLSLLPSEESTKWWTSNDQSFQNLSPVISFSTPHAAGLNFSRSWGLWTLFQKTGDLVFRDLYVRHIVTHMEMPEYWGNDYQKHGHWVPQFGIYAIALSMEVESM